MRIVELTPTHLPELTEHAGAMFREVNYPGTFNPETFVAYWQLLVQMKTGTILGVRKDERLIGALGWVTSPSPFTGDLHAADLFFYVLPEYRRGRAAYLLVSEFLMRMQDQGVKVAYLSEAAASPGVRRMLEKYGFEVDHTIMRKVL